VCQRKKINIIFSVAVRAGAPKFSTEVVKGGKFIGLAQDEFTQG